MLKPHGLLLFTREGFIIFALMISLRSIELQPQKVSKKGRRWINNAEGWFGLLSANNHLVILLMVLNDEFGVVLLGADLHIGQIYTVG